MSADTEGLLDELDRQDKIIAELKIGYKILQDKYDCMESPNGDWVKAEDAAELKSAYLDMLSHKLKWEEEAGRVLRINAELKLNIKTERKLWAELRPSIEADAIEEMISHFKTRCDEYNEYPITLFEARMYAAQLRNK